MSKKPGIFSRLKNSISSTLSDAVEAVSDPGQEVALMLDDLAAQIKKSEVDLRQAMVDYKVMERKREQIEKDESAWQARAEQAVKISDDTLARAALRRKGEISTEKRILDESMVEQRKLVESMRDGLKEARSRHKSLNLRRGSLMAQARAAKKGQDLSTEIASGGGAAARLNAIEDKISQLEALNEVNSAELSEKAAEVELESQFSKLDAVDELDDELASLKAKLNSKAITDGKG
ncbi:MAG: PspA/IM30 family protein [Nannocystaceae bacterium]|nr:PspA/IM30 family protein [Myxococcales bacterium]